MKAFSGILLHGMMDILGAGIVLALFFLTVSLLIILLAPLLGPSLPLI
jgi:hypothetical protein